MKKSILYMLVFLSACVPACKKDNSKSSTPVTASVMNSTETTLLGKWYFQKSEYRNAGNILTTTDTMEHFWKDYMDLQSTVSSVETGNYNCSFTYGPVSPNVSYWTASGSVIDVPDYTRQQSPGSLPAQIMVLNSTTLIYNHNAGSDTTHGGVRYYYHR